MEYRTDEEQIERLKGWWTKFGNYIVYGIILIFGLVYGLKAWQDSRSVLLDKASSLYTRALNAFSVGKKDEFQANSNQLLADHTDSVYSDFVRLLLAKEAIKSGKMKQAEDYLQYVINKTKQKSLKHIATLRLARIYYSNGSYENAEKQLLNLDDTEFEFFAHEIRGDISLRNKQYKAANNAYKLALEKHKSKIQAVDVMIKHKLESIPADKI